jgi:hypothetical protein
MSETSLQKIDKYYLSLSIILILMAALLIFSFKGIFSAFLTAGSFDPSNLETQIRVNQSNLSDAYSWAFSRNVVKLESEINK